MKTFNLIYLVIFTLTITSCNFHKPEELAHNPLFDFKGKTIAVQNKIIVGKGETFDGHGNLYDWKGEGNCSQDEGMPPMFVLGPNSTLKNVFMRNAPDGIHVKGSNVTIDNIVNVDVCEDAISISKSKHHLVGDNIKIINSKFYNCQDKAIQLSRGSNILIMNNEFYQCAKAVRIKEEAANVRFEYNKVFNSQSAIKATGGTGSVKGNMFRGSREALWAEKDALLTDGGDNVFLNVVKVHHITEGGKISALKK